jgi:hypothetical protein
MLRSALRTRLSEGWQLPDDEVRGAKRADIVAGGVELDQRAEEMMPSTPALSQSSWMLGRRAATIARGKGKSRVEFPRRKSIYESDHPVGKLINIKSHVKASPGERQEGEGVSQRDQNHDLGEAGNESHLDRRSQSSNRLSFAQSGLVFAGNDNSEQRPQPAPRLRC